MQEIWSGPAKNSAVMAVMTSTPRLASHYRGEAVMRLSSQPYDVKHDLFFYKCEIKTASRWQQLTVNECVIEIQPIH